MKIIITGTSRGLGNGIASHLAAHGYFVVGCARGHGEVDVPENKKPFYQHISGIDLNDVSTFSKLEDHFLDADVLINNAAIAFDGLLATQGEQSIEEIIRVNLTAPLVLSKRYVRARLKARKPGNIINVSSIIGIRGYAGLASYASTKAGLDGMTRSLARELGSKGFRVNSILPGYMETDMSKSLGSLQKNKIINRTPLGRLATIEDITPVIKFLISNDSKFITGQSIVVDGGITV